MDISFLYFLTQHPTSSFNSFHHHRHHHSNHHKLTMNSSINHLTTTTPNNFHHHRPYLPTLKPYLHRTTAICSLHRRRHLRRRRHSDSTTTNTPNSTSPQPDSKLHMVIDFDQYLPDKASISLNNLLKTSKLNFNQFIDSGNDAVNDLRTLITVDGDRKVVVSCRKSTVYFIGQLIVVSLVTVFTFKVLVKLGLGFRSLFRGRGNDGGVVVTRRDRSLGGREVVVSTLKESKTGFNPLDSGEELMMRDSNIVMKNWEKTRKKLPDWWPDSRPAPLEGIDKEENQRKANWLIRGWFLKCEKHENVVGISL